MSVTVDQSWTYRFHDNLLLTYQQKGSLLMNLMDPGMVHRDIQAAIDHHERLGNVIANDVVVPFGQTRILNPEHSRRACTLVSSDAAVLVSDEHNLRSMINPQNGYTNTIVYALGRRADKHIIDNLIGASATAAVTTGSGVITYGSTALPTGQKIGTGIAITLANIIAAGVKLSKAGVPPGSSERVFLYSPGQLSDIMAITQASSSDFTRNRIHDKGTINGIDWEGFQWIEIADVVDPSVTLLQTMLPNGAASGLGLTGRANIAFHKSCIGLSLGKDITTRIHERPDLQSCPIQVRSAMMMTAVRVFEGGVVQLDVLEN